MDPVWIAPERSVQRAVALTNRGGAVHVDGCTDRRGNFRQRRAVADKFPVYKVKTDHANLRLVADVWMDGRGLRRAGAIASVTQPALKRARTCVGRHSTSSSGLYHSPSTHHRPATNQPRPTIAQQPSTEPTAAHHRRTIDYRRTTGYDSSVLVSMPADLPAAAPDAPGTPSDPGQIEALIQRCLKGDQRAWELIVR